MSDVKPPPRFTLPAEAYELFVQQNQFTEATISAFAAQIGIVVGRLQHDGHLPATIGNELKRCLVWKKGGNRFPT